jgi:hypothetical protein
VREHYLRDILIKNQRDNAGVRPPKPARLAARTRCSVGGERAGQGGGRAARAGGRDLRDGAGSDRP